MNIEEKLIMLITHELTLQEAQEFQDQIDKSPDLQKTKRQFEDIITIVRSQSEKKLRKKLDVYLKEYLDEQTKTKKNRYLNPYWYAGIAASITLVGVLTYNTFMKSSDNTPMQFQMDDMPIRSDSASYTPDSLSLPIDSVKIKGE